MVVPLSLRQAAWSTASVAFLICASAASARGAVEKETFHVDGHVFKVPQNYLPYEIPWLPVSGTEGLLFIVNPNAPPKKQESVVVESMRVRCDFADTARSPQSSEVCMMAGYRSLRSFSEKDGMEKIKIDKGPEKWTYRLISKAPASFIIASCVKISGAMAFSCYSMNNYDNLICNIEVDDKDVRRLPAIWHAVQRLLASWEARKG